MILLYEAIVISFRLIEILIVVRILFSFLNMGRSNLLTSIVYDVTDIVLEPPRALIRSIGISTGMFDFSPLIAIWVLRALSNFILIRLM